MGRLEELITAATAGVTAEALAVSLTVGDDSAIRCRGAVADVPVTSRTVFYAASVTKQFIGYLAARAVDGGRIDHEAVRHLVHHTAGTDPPGLGFRYSNAGYVQLAERIGDAYGRPIATVAQEVIFEPLGMADSRLGGPAVAVSGVSDPPTTVGDGGLWTTVDDLTTWLRWLNQQRDDPAVVLMESPGTLGDGTPIDYAWGVRVTTTDTGSLITHGGSWDAWLAKTVRRPTQQVVVAVLSLGSEETMISDLGVRLALGA